MNRNPDIGSFSARSGVTQSSGNAPLLEYALDGLRRCWLPEHRRWSHIYHLDGRESPNESLPRSDVFYTLNVLLGMSRVAYVPRDIDVAEIYRRNAFQLTAMPVAKYAFGMALWAAAELQLDVPEDVAVHVNGLLAETAGWHAFRAQDIGMLLTGIVAQARVGRKDLYQFAAPLFAFLRDRYHNESGLFCDAPAGLRRRFASFATQTYLAIACYHYGELTGDASAIAMANACVRKLIALQGPYGEWPWFFDAWSGKVLDFYEVYSVHQYGMAPALLECAERHDVYEANAALVRGFKWVFGENELGRPMLVPELQLSIRSQVRKGELHTKSKRIQRAIWNVATGRSSSLIGGAGVDLRLECRSYELGWILWSFGRRSDLRQLTHHPGLMRAVLSADAL